MFLRRKDRCGQDLCAPEGTACLCQCCGFRLNTTLRANFRFDVSSGTGQEYHLRSRCLDLVDHRPLISFAGYRSSFFYSAQANLFRRIPLVSHVLLIFRGRTVETRTCADSSEPLSDSRQIDLDPPFVYQQSYRILCRVFKLMKESDNARERRRKVCDCHRRSVPCVSRVNPALDREVTLL